MVLSITTADFAMAVQSDPTKTRLNASYVRRVFPDVASAKIRLYVLAVLEGTMWIQPHLLAKAVVSWKDVPPATPQPTAILAYRVSI